MRILTIISTLMNMIMSIIMVTSMTIIMGMITITTTTPPITRMRRTPA
jgi:hypothetical protein